MLDDKFELEIKALKNIVVRERKARKKAEAILEKKSLEIFDKNEELKLAYDKLKEDAKNQTELLNKLKQSLIALKIDNTKNTIPEFNDNDLISLANKINLQIEQRRKAEKSLIEKDLNLQLTSNKLASLIKSINLGVIFESSDSIIEIINSEFLDLFKINFSSDFFIGTDSLRFHNEVKSSFLDEFAFIDDYEKIKKLKEQKTKEILFLKNSNVFERDYIPIFNNEEFIGNLWIYRDVTSQKIFEIELKNAKDAAEKLNRDKSIFFAIMSHEIRTPMNGIVGMTSLLLNESLDNKSKDYVETIRVCADNLLTIINDILDFSKIESGNLDLEYQTFELHKCIEDVLKLFTLDLKKKKVSLSFNIDKNVPLLINTDLTRLRQILVNLVGNAFKFTESGYVLINVKLVKIESNKINLLFLVEDSGIGIDKSKLKNLFKAYSQEDNTTTRKYGGTGLGLAICKKLTKLLGGNIWADSQKNKGSKFYFSINSNLPNEKEIIALNLDTNFKQGVNISSREVIKKNNKIENLKKKYPIKILVAEDNNINQKLVKNIFEVFGYIIDIANNGLEVIDSLYRQKYDLVFMDVNMPEMDGLESTRKINELFSENEKPIIIAMTANAMTGDKEICLKSGMDDYITKPIDIHLLKEKIIYWSEKLILKPDFSENILPIIKTDIHFDKDIFDSNVIKDLAEISGMSELEFVDDMAVDLINDVQLYIHNFDSMIDEKDFKQIEDISHKLKGSCLSLGINKLGMHLSNIEKYSHQNLIKQVLSEIEILKDCFQETELVIEKYMENIS